MIAEATRPITEREEQVWRLTAEGLTRKEIAARLCLSDRTVEAHHYALARKLGVSYGGAQGAKLTRLWMERNGTVTK